MNKIEKSEYCPRWDVSVFVREIGQKMREIGLIRRKGKKESNLNERSKANSEGKLGN